MMSATHVVIPRAVTVAMPRNKEMCHEETHRRFRVDLVDRDPVAQRECECSPGIAIELLVRRQRLLTCQE